MNEEIYPKNGYIDHKNGYSTIEFVIPTEEWKNFRKTAQFESFCKAVESLKTETEAGKKLIEKETEAMLAEGIIAPCPNCQTLMPTNYRYCTKCGNNLD